MACCGPRSVTMLLDLEALALDLTKRSWPLSCCGPRAFALPNLSVTDPLGLACTLCCIDSVELTSKQRTQSAEHLPCSRFPTAAPCTRLLSDDSTCSSLSLSAMVHSFQEKKPECDLSFLQGHEVFVMAVLTAGQL